ncbi:MAG: hypothetical protein ACT4PY_16825 [Armatimonadota bacterium]
MKTRTHTPSGTGMLLAGAIIAAAVFAFPPAAPAQKLSGPVMARIRTQLATAILHAEQASRASTVPIGHAHMRRVINCLQGQRGAMFRREAGNPCQGQGDGIMPDLKAAAALGVTIPETATQGVTTAFNTAVATICMLGLASVRADSLAVANQLKAVLAAVNR